MTFINPYGFIPLGEDGPKRRGYESGNLTGYISYVLETKSSLFIPNVSSDKAFRYTHTKDENGDNDDPEEKHVLQDFFSLETLNENETYDDRYFEPIIPGSEIRGMIRSIHEALTDSCISQFNGDTPIGKRTVEHFKPGVLVQENEKVILYQAEDAIYRNPNDFSQKYYKKDFLPEGVKDGQCVSVKLDKSSSKGKQKVTSKGKQKVINFCGNTEGYLMLGEDGPEIVREGKRVLKAEKHCAHVFIPEQDQKVAEIPEIENLGLVIKMYQKENENAYKEYEESYNKFEKGKTTGLPVYYSVIKIDKVKDKVKDKVVMLSPACITREVYNHCPKDLIKPYEACGSNDDKKICPSCALFGLISKNGFTKGSNIRFTDATVCEKKENKEYYDSGLYTMPTLSQPKLANTEFYLKKPVDGDGEVWFWTYDYYTVKKADGTVIVKEYTPAISGRKFYWHGDKVDGCQHKKRYNKTVRTVKSGEYFKGRVYFENITQEQLQQLYYIFQYTSDDQHGYKLGGGKPIGLGSVCFKICDVKIRSFTINNVNHNQINDCKDNDNNNHDNNNHDYDYKENDYVKNLKQANCGESFNQTSLQAFGNISKVLSDEEKSLVKYPGEGDEGFKWFVDNKCYYKPNKGELTKTPRSRTQTKIKQALPAVDNPRLN